MKVINVDIKAEDLEKVETEEDFIRMLMEKSGIKNDEENDHDLDMQEMLNEAKEGLRIGYRAMQSYLCFWAAANLEDGVHPCWARRVKMFADLIDQIQEVRMSLEDISKGNTETEGDCD